MNDTTSLTVPHGLTHFDPFPVTVVGHLPRFISSPRLTSTHQCTVMDGWMDGWMMSGWMDGWMDDEWMDG